MSVTVSFFGLCMLVDRDGNVPYEVYLSKDKDHEPAMSMPVGSLDIVKSTWEPDRILHVLTGEDSDGNLTFVQLACWDLSGDIEFNTLGTEPAWGADRDHCMNFTFHGGDHKVKRKGTFSGLPDTTLFLSGGNLKASAPEESLQIKKGETADPQSISRFVTWSPMTGTVKISSSKGFVITKAGARTPVTITNVSTDPTADPDKHLDLYYDLLKGDVPTKDRIRFVHQHARSPQVYDCVPPGTGS
jgi:hypothetical protein